MRAIIICSCSGMEKKALYAFGLLFPDEDAPLVHRGESAVRQLAEPYPDTNFARYISAILKKSGKWAYYLEVNKQGDIIDLYDLMTAKRIG